MFESYWCVCVCVCVPLAAATPSALVDLTEDAPSPNVEESKVTLVSMEPDAMETEEVSDKKRKKQKQSKKRSGGRKEKAVLVTPVAEDQKEEEEKEEKERDLDDLDFWLSKGDAPTPKKKQVCL